MITEAELENLAITWFQENGWSFVHGPDIAHDGPTPERTGYNEVVLRSRLRETLERINRQLSPEVQHESLTLQTLFINPHP